VSGADQQHAVEELQLQRDTQPSSRTRHHLRTGRITCVQVQDSCQLVTFIGRIYHTEA